LQVVCCENYEQEIGYGEHSSTSYIIIIFDVFLEELPRLPPKRELEFMIELKLGTKLSQRLLITWKPWNCESCRCKLQELLDLGFIHPSISPWGVNDLCKEERWIMEALY
jgi:hypothetical protein